MQNFAFTKTGKKSVTNSVFIMDRTTNFEQSVIILISDQILATEDLEYHSDFLNHLFHCFFFNLL